MENRLNQLGVDCPQCQSFVHTPLDVVLFTSQLSCELCATAFTLDETNSGHLLKQLREMDYSY